MIVEEVERIQLGVAREWHRVPGLAAVCGVPHLILLPHSPAGLIVEKLNAPHDSVYTQVLLRPGLTAVGGMQGKTSAANSPAGLVVYEPDTVHLIGIGVLSGPVCATI